MRWSSRPRLTASRLTSCSWCFQVIAFTFPVALHLRGIVGIRRHVLCLRTCLGGGIADAADLKSGCREACAGSTPALGTTEPSCYNN